MKVMSTALVLLLLGGCQSAPDPKLIDASWRTSSHTNIIVNQDQLGVTLHSARSKNVPGGFLIHDAQWRGERGWPRIRLVLHDLSPARMTFASNNPFDKPLETRIHKAFGQYPLDIGEQRQMSSGLGTVRVQRFEVNGANQCVFLGLFTSPSRGIKKGAGKELGQRYMEGTYCTESGEGLKEHAIVSFVNNLAIAD